MDEQLIGRIAAAQLAKETGWQVIFQKNENSSPGNHISGRDGTLSIKSESKNHHIHLEIKKKLRRARIPFLKEKQSNFSQWLLLSDYLSQPLQRELRENRINYLDTAGNAFLQMVDLFILVEGKKPNPKAVDEIRLRFKPSEISLLISLLISQNLLNESYRTLENLLGTSKSTISKLFNKLKGEKFLVELNGSLRFQNCQSLLEVISSSYYQTFKPKILLQRFQFVKKTGPRDWQNWTLPEGTRWGGEPAAALYNEYLSPGEWSIYSTNSSKELLLKLPIKPDSQGPISLFQQFWNSENLEMPTQHIPIVPLPLIYIDLWGSGDGRNKDAARNMNLHLC
ncbi:MAG: type IV toxin-antitoxin system AbiEi family antitoxin [Bacteroidota bacterium]